MTIPRKPKQFKEDDATGAFARIQREWDQTVKVRADKREEEHWELRKKFISDILSIFIKANIVVLTCVGIAIALDMWHGGTDAGYADKRIFNTNVLMALIASTTVQLGAIALSISNWLFNDRNK